MGPSARNRAKGARDKGVNKLKTAINIFFNSFETNVNTITDLFSLHKSHCTNLTEKILNGKLDFLCSVYKLTHFWPMFNVSMLYPLKISQNLPWWFFNRYKMGTITRNELKDWFPYDGNMMVLNRLTKSLPHFNNDYY